VTAFHGAPPTNDHFVDHIDTNKQNNRPANLRWVTGDCTMVQLRMV